MSWSFYETGRPGALARKAAEDLGKFTCPEPEETVKHHALAILEAALGAMAENMAVRIEAAGSQSEAGASKVNTLRFEIIPVYNFVE